MIADTHGKRRRRGTMAEEHPDKLRELALWYREFAERAGNPTIWESRLRTAEDLDAAAEHMERLRRRSIAGSHGQPPPEG
jgi:hypothetical protein